jgi:hypothetical protein
VCSTSLCTPSPGSRSGAAQPSAPHYWKGESARPNSAITKRAWGFTAGSGLIGASWLRIVGFDLANFVKSIADELAAGERQMAVRLSASLTTALADMDATELASFPEPGPSGDDVATESGGSGLKVVRGARYSLSAKELDSAERFRVPGRGLHRRRSVRPRSGGMG